jgi:RNA polymerase sigma factor (sigma-70 family)
VEKNICVTVVHCQAQTHNAPQTKGDEGAVVNISMARDITALFEVYHREVERFLTRRVHSPEIAADLAQETYLRLLSVPNMDKIDDLRGFLFTIASNLARDYLRQRSRHEQVDSGSLDSSIPSPAPSIEALMDAQRHVALLQQVIDELPPKTRAVLVLYRVEGCSYRDIATLLDMSPRTVEYHLRQALLHCRKRLKPVLNDPELHR